MASGEYRPVCKLDGVCPVGVGGGEGAPVKDEEAAALVGLLGMGEAVPVQPDAKIGDSAIFLGDPLLPLNRFTECCKLHEGMFRNRGELFRDGDDR